MTLSDTETQVGLPALEALAYSAEEPSTAEVPHQHSWHTVIRNASGFVLLGILVAGSLVAAMPRGHQVSAAPASAAPATEVSTPELPLSTVQADVASALGATAQPVTKAGAFGQLVRASGLIKVIDTRQYDGIGGSLCDWMIGSPSDEQTARDLVGHIHFEDGGDANLDQTRVLVKAAHQVYCPNR